MQFKNTLEVEDAFLVSNSSEYTLCVPKVHEDKVNAFSGGIIGLSYSLPYNEMLKYVRGGIGRKGT